MNAFLEEKLNITELFSSIQGETSFAGLPTAFVRLAQCNLRCSWCDTPYSFGRGTPYTLASIIEQVERYSCRYVCITGGEPLLQKNVHPLMAELCDRGYTLSIETGGSLSVSAIDPRVHIILDIKCPASTMSAKNYWKNLEIIRRDDQVKFVIQDEHDFSYAKEVCQKYNLYEKAGEVLFSPAHGLLDPKQLLAWMLHDKIAGRINLQLHKYIWPPETPGV